MYTPYNRDFVTAIKGVGSARWSADSRAWVCREEDADAAKAILRRIYGEDGESVETRYTVKIRLTEDLRGDRAPVVYMGKQLASARGRDTGARVGEDVILEKGSVISGGSRANWESIAREGAEFSLKHVGQELIDEKMEGVEVLSIEEETEIDKEALMAEKERLTARIAEIDKMLAE